MTFQRLHDAIIKGTNESKINNESKIYKCELNYIQRKSPQPPKTPLTAIEQLKSDIVVTKPNKGSGVVVMDKTEYIRSVPLERPKSRGRPPKHYDPLLNKCYNLPFRTILPKDIPEPISPSGSRLAHLYELPKTHKENLAVCPILSARSTYNYALAKWLDDKLKPLSLNQHTVADIFDFVNEVRELKINKGYILVSYDESSLFTNVPLEETSVILTKKAFRDNWFNSTYNLNISKALIDLLNVSTKGQLFQFNGALYEQSDGVAMGSPLGPLLANVFMSSLEKKVELEGKLPDYYRRYVDNTLTIMPNITTAVTKSGTGTWDLGRGDSGTWGRGDSGTWGRGDSGTWGRGDVGTWGLGDSGTRGLGDVGTWGRGDTFLPFV